MLIHGLTLEQGIRKQRSIYWVWFNIKCSPHKNTRKIHLTHFQKWENWGSENPSPQGKEVVDLRLKSTSVSAKAHAVYDVTLSFPHELCGRSWISKDRQELSRWKRKGWERTEAGGLWQRVGADTEAHKDWSLQETKWLGLAGRGLYPRMAGDELKQTLAGASTKMKSGGKVQFQGTATRWCSELACDSMLARFEEAKSQTQPLSLFRQTDRQSWELVSRRQKSHLPG